MESAEQTVKPYRVTFARLDHGITFHFATPAEACEKFERIAEIAKPPYRAELRMLNEDGSAWIEPAWNMETTLDLQS